MPFSDNDIAFLIALGAFLIGALIYFIPTIVAAKKKSPKLTMIILLDVFLAWTFVAWVVCLVLACKKPAPADTTQAPDETKTPEVEKEPEPAKAESGETEPEVETV